ncbi:hypothetical protein ACIHEJ_29035 [Streptomyces sp. NPDC052301]|uniref:hypothetical protein n=1 Tax=Streptomyces sp. NPDC052301 TaxID=3365687 RepID=UPI0037D9044B
MKRSVIALVSAGAFTLAAGGYAVGAARHDSASEQSATCRQAGDDFGKRAIQLRKQKKREAHDEDYLNSMNTHAESAHVQILGLIVEQNPTCFGGATRAAAAYLQEPRSTDAEGAAQEDAAACELLSIPFKDCSVTADD